MSVCVKSNAITSDDTVSSSVTSYHIALDGNTSYGIHLM